jgi:hypothetical protein
VAFGGIVSAPRNALNTLREAARLKNFEADVVSRQTTVNALALCGIGKHPSAEGLKGSCGTSGARIVSTVMIGGVNQNAEKA